MVNPLGPPPSTGSADPATLLGDWSRDGSGSLARRLALALRTAVVTGVLPAGTRLPPERALADSLAVSRSTLAAALDELRSEGLVVSRQGSGTTVVGAGPTGRAGGPRMVDQLLDHGWGINLAAAAPADASHLPDLALTSSDLLRVVPGHGYEPTGLPALRAACADRHTAQGLRTRPEQIHVTNGAHHALDLVVDTFVRAGDPVVVDDPTYPGVHDVLARHGARAVPVGGDERGVDPDALADALDRTGARLVYLQPGVHNPTGRVTGDGRRRALAEVLDRPGLTVIEDQVLADLADDGRRPPPLAELCRQAQVVTLESLGKSAWGGLRIGWLRADGPTVERTVRTRRAADLGSSVPSQLLALALLPRLDELAATRRQRVGAAAVTTIAALSRELPAWQVGPRAGGLSLWVELPVDDSGPFVQLARRHGVHVAPGSAATPHRPDPHIRVCVDRPAPQLTAGVARLAGAWADLTNRARVLG